MIKLERVTRTWQGTKMAWAGLRLIRDPGQLNEVFALADSIQGVDAGVIRQMADGFRRHSDGARALRERPRLQLPPLAVLAALPAGTVGRAFADYLSRNGIDPSALPRRPSPDELSYVRAHLFETHDLWHVATGFETDVAGELGLQAFYLAQAEGRLPLAILAIGILNTAGWAFGERQARFDAIARGWLLGKRARPLFGLIWSERWSQPLAELRAELGLSLTDVDQMVAVASGTPAVSDPVLRSVA